MSLAVVAYYRRILYYNPFLQLVIEARPSGDQSNIVFSTSYLLVYFVALIFFADVIYNGHASILVFYLTDGI